MRSCLSTRGVLACAGQGGAGRRPASGGTPNPHTPPCIGRDAQPTYPALHRAGRPTHIPRPASGGTPNPHSGSRILREAPRHRAGERWCQRNANRSSREVVHSRLSTRKDRRSLRWAGRRWTPPCIGRGRPTHIVGRASCARLPGIVPGSDGVNETRIVPLGRLCVRVSLLGRIVVTCAGQGGAGPRPASGEDAQPTYPALHRAGRPTHIPRPASGGALNPQARSKASAAYVASRRIPSGRIRRDSGAAGGADRAGRRCPTSIRGRSDRVD